MAAQLTPLELKGREIVAALDNDSPSIAVRQIFEAFPVYAFSADELESMALTLHKRHFDLRPALTRAVRSKILRSRMIDDARCYEINFPD